MSWRALTFMWIASAIACLCAWSLWTTQTTAGGIRLEAGFTQVLPENAVPWSRVDRIVITRSPENRFEFVRRDGRWFQTHPFDFPVESAQVMEVVDRATALVAREPIAGEEAAAQTLRKSAGLDASSPSIVFGWGDDQATIRLGRRLPAGFAWVDLGQDRSQPRAARSSLHDATLMSDLRQWRQPMLFARADVECDRLVCESVARDGSSQRLEVVRDGPDWKVVSPIATRADRVAVERWLDALARAQATGFVVDRPTDLAPFGLAKPSGIVEIHSTVRASDGSGRLVAEQLTERLEIGSPIRAGAQERFARLANHPDAIMEIDATAVAAAIPPTLLMIDPTATGVRPEDIRAVRLEPLAGDALRIERLGADWQISNSSGTRPAVSENVGWLLGKLCQHRAAEIMLRSAPADLVVGRIIVESFDGREISSLSVSRERNEGRYGFDDGSGVLRIFSPSLGLSFDSRTYESPPQQ